MKTKHFFTALICWLMLAGVAIAQPYTLDQEIKPVKLELQEDTKYEGAKGITTNATLNEEETHYYYVVGHDLFQFVDVYIFSNYGNPSLEATLVKNNWKDAEEVQNSASEEDGIINFKLRTQGDFGFRIRAPKNDKINYTIIVYTTEPIMEYLESPFVKATDENTASGSGSGSGSGDSNLLLYGALGLALLIIGFLAARLMGRKRAATIFIFAFMLIPGMSYAQYHGGGYWDPENTRNGSYEEWLRQQSDRHQREGIVGDMQGLKRLGQLTGDLNGKLDNVVKKYKVIKELYDAYTGLGDCINSVPLPGSPRVPSFCEGNSECGTCFVQARKDLQNTRYTFEKLKTIYTCTKRFTDKAIAFGDNVSGVHGVSGLAWQAERVKIEKSVLDLQKAYDKKYIELLDKLQNALVDLSNCEAEHGIPDWYDRFGYLYYDFIKFHYARQN